MELVTFDSQVETLYHHLRNGMKINRINAYQLFGVGDIRSRVSDIQREYGIVLDREKVPNKRYLQYFIKEKQLKLF